MHATQIFVYFPILNEKCISCENIPSSLSFTEGCDVTVFPLAIPWVWRAVGAAVWNKGLG